MIYFQSFTVVGIAISSNDNTIINNFIADARFDGVFAGEGDRNIVKGNTIVNAGSNGINLSSLPVSSTTYDNQVLDNTIIYSDTGIFVGGGKRTVISREIQSTKVLTEEFGSSQLRI